MEKPSLDQNDTQSKELQQSPERDYNLTRDEKKKIIFDEYLKGSEYEDMDLEEAVDQLLANSNMTAEDVLHELGFWKGQSDFEIQNNKWRSKDPGRPEAIGAWEDPQMIKSFVKGMAEAKSVDDQYKVLRDLMWYLNVPFQPVEGQDPLGLQELVDKVSQEELTPESIVDNPEIQGIIEENERVIDESPKIPSKNKSKIKEWIKRAALISLILASGHPKNSQETQAHGPVDLGDQVELVDSQKEHVYQVKPGDTVYEIVQNQLGDSASPEEVRQKTIEVLKANGIGSKYFGLEDAGGGWILNCNPAQI